MFSMNHFQLETKSDDEFETCNTHEADEVCEICNTFGLGVFEDYNTFGLVFEEKPTVSSKDAYIIYTSSQYSIPTIDNDKIDSFELVAMGLTMWIRQRDYESVQNWCINTDRQIVRTVLNTKMSSFCDNTLLHMILYYDVDNIVFDMYKLFRSLGGQPVLNKLCYMPYNNMEQEWNHLDPLLCCVRDSGEFKELYERVASYELLII